MKKIFSILLIACVAMLFSACHKEGVYNPNKKISKIWFTDANGTRTLQEAWTWNKDNTLEKIDYYSANGALAYTMNFTYEKKRLTRMNVYSNNVYIDYKYEGKNLKEVALYSNGTLIDQYTFTYKNGKISNFTDTYFGAKADVDVMISPLQYILPDEIYSPIETICKKNHEDSKATTTSNYELTWEKNNLVKLLRTSTTSDQTIEMKAEYDKKNNPFYGAFTELFFENNVINGYESQNNVTRAEIISNNGGQVTTNIINYEYSYDGKYPKSRKLLENNQTTVTEFEYTK